MKNRRRATLGSLAVVCAWTLSQGVAAEPILP